LRELKDHVTQLQAEMATRADLANLRAEHKANIHEALHRNQVEMRQMMQALLSSHAGSSGAGGVHREQDHTVGQLHAGGYFHQEGPHNTDGLKPKTIRWEFPGFDGEDPKTWSCKAEQYFDYYDTPDPQRLSIASFRMEGRAMVWFQELKASNNMGSWEEFVQALQIRFGKGAYEDPMESLSNLKQDGSLEEHKD